MAKQKQERMEEKKRKRNEMRAKRNNPKKHKFTKDDWDELQKEERLFKKLKKGQISKKEFNSEVNESDDDFSE